MNPPYFNTSSNDPAQFLTQAAADQYNQAQNQSNHRSSNAASNSEHDQSNSHFDQLAEPQSKRARVESSSDDQSNQASNQALHPMFQYQFPPFDDPSMQQQGENQQEQSTYTNNQSTSQTVNQPSQSMNQQMNQSVHQPMHQPSHVPHAPVHKPHEMHAPFYSHFPIVPQMPMHQSSMNQGLTTHQLVHFFDANEFAHSQYQALAFNQPIIQPMNHLIGHPFPMTHFGHPVDQSSHSMNQPISQHQQIAANKQGSPQQLQFHPVFTQAPNQSTDHSTLTQPPTQPMPFVCWYQWCQAGFDSEDQLIDHLSVKHPAEANQCRECLFHEAKQSNNSSADQSKEGITRDQLVEHMSLFHPMLPPYFCPCCGDDIEKDVDPSTNESTHTCRYGSSKLGPLPVGAQVKHSFHSRPLISNPHLPHLKWTCFYTYCNEKFDSDEQLQLHLSINHPLNSSTQQFRCQHCPLLLNTYQARKNHVERVHPKNLPHFCPQCGEQFMIYRDVARHQCTPQRRQLMHMLKLKSISQATHQNTINQQAIDQSISQLQYEIDSSIKQSINHSMSTSHDLAANTAINQSVVPHSGSRGGPRRSGSTPNYQPIENIMDYQFHQPPTDQPLVCWFEYCEESFDSEKTLFHHLVDVHSPSKFPCRLCPTYCITQSKLIAHLKSNHPAVNQARYWCAYCGQAFKKALFVTQHKCEFLMRVQDAMEQEAERRFAMRASGEWKNDEEATDSEADLNESTDGGQAADDDDIPISQAIAQSANKKRTRKSVSKPINQSVNQLNEQSSHCFYTHCVQSFHSTDALQSHLIDAHTQSNNQSVYQCLYCPTLTQFSDRSQLIEHIKSMHPTEKAFFCRVCGDKFATWKDGLKEHKC